VIRLAVAFVLAGLAVPAWAAQVDAPQLAAPGPYPVGVESRTLVQPDQTDPIGHALWPAGWRGADRLLPVDIWYPAKTKGPAAAYHGALTGEDGKDVAFALTGLASRGAAEQPGRWPLVILAHGYGGNPAVMSWIGENLASKGYVVVAPAFDDPPYGKGEGLAGPLARRPLDIAFVAREAGRLAAARSGALAGADPTRTALIGYSMGGYGVLTAAGARLAPAAGPLTKGALTPYVAGGAKSGELDIPDLKAVVAISPAGLFPGFEAWGAEGLAHITAPTLFIVGSQDKLVGYDPGVKTLFGQEIHAPRWLLVFENAGHAIGMGETPNEMRGRLWDLDWFEDPVWRKDRLIAIQLHFITAFLDAEVKGDADKRAFLEVAEPESNKGVWPQKPGDPYDAVSPGVPPITVWKGFKRGHAAGLELRYAAPGA
jgi:predicted dienelactone hydrolase